MNDSRLEQISPDLLDRLANASQAQRRMAAKEACLSALRSNGLSETLLDDALASISLSTSSFDRRDELQRLVDEYDEAYFDLQDAHDRGDVEKAEVLKAFGRARSSNAVLYATDNENKHFAEEAFYEAHAASVPVDELGKNVDQVIGGNSDA